MSQEKKEQKAKLNFWNGKMLVDSEKSPITMDIGSGEIKFTVMIKGAYEEYNPIKHGNQKISINGEEKTYSQLIERYIDSLNELEGTSKKLKDGQEMSVEINDSHSGNQKCFENLEEKVSGFAIPALATGAWRTCKLKEGSAIKTLSPSDESKLTAVSNELCKDGADVTIAGGIGYLKGAFGISEKMDVKDLANLARKAQYKDSDLGKNTINFGRMIAALAYVEDAGITTDVSVSSGNSTMGIVHKKIKFANNFAADKPIDELYQEEAILEHTMKALDKAIKPAIEKAYKEKGLSVEERGKMEVMLSAVLMRDYLTTKPTLSEEDFIKKHEVLAANLLGNKEDLEKRFTEMLEKIEKSERTLKVAREVPVMERNEGQTLKQAVAEDLKAHAGEKSARVAKFEKLKIQGSMDKFKGKTTLPLPRAKATQQGHDMV